MGTAFLVTAAALALQGAPARPAPARSVLRVPDDGTRLAFRDVDGDGDLDLVLVGDQGLSVHHLDPDGTYAAAPDTRLDWPAEDVAWCLVDADGDGATEVACLVGGREVRLFPVRQPGEPGAGERLLDVAASLPHGRFRMDFFRDVDGDGRLDLVIPSFGSFAIHLRRADGGWAPPFEVRLRVELDQEVGDPTELDSAFGQEVRIPWFELDDISGDGRPDLVAETDDAVSFHVADPELPAEPTWTLDLAALRDELPGSDQVDLDDLLAAAGRQVEWRIADLDGEGAKDLILQVGSTFRVYRGGSLTGPDESPDQVLKASGNVLHFFVRQVQGDQLPELQLLRGESLSLGRVLRWLVFPGSLDFELFTYRNEGGAFSRKPTRRNTLSLEFPRLLAFVSRMQALERELDEREPVPATRADLDGDGSADDVLDVRDGELLVYVGDAPDEEDALADLEGDDVDAILESFLVREIDRLEDGGKKTLDLGKLDELVRDGGAVLREACATVAPDRRIPLAPGLEDPSIYVRDLDGDGRQDFVVSGMADGVHVLQFLVDRGP